jgi:hypothetical protein
MPTAAQCKQLLEQYYELFGAGRFADIARLLSDDAWYSQLNSMTHANSPRGRAKVVAALTQWGQWFEDIDILGPVMNQLGETEVRKVGGSVAAFQAEYSLAGRYVRAIPGLRERPLRVGQHVSIYVTDRVWLNGSPQISNIASSFIIF